MTGFSLKFPYSLPGLTGTWIGQVEIQWLRCCDINNRDEDVSPTLNNVIKNPVLIKG